MSQREEKQIRGKRIVIALMEYVIVLGCLITLFVMLTPKERIKQTSSYAKPEEVSEYRIVNGYMTRIRPLTEYGEFVEIAKATMRKEKGNEYEIKVYQDANKEEEVTSGIIVSGMKVVCEGEGELTRGVIGTEEYEANVVGDITRDGDINVTELTQIIRHIIGIERIEEEGKELSADINGDGQINVTDVSMCINYIVYGTMEKDQTAPMNPEIEIEGEGNKEAGWYRSDIEVRIENNEREEGEIEKTQTIVEIRKEGEETRTQSTTEREFRLSREGEYKITAQNYGVNGQKSEVVTRTVRIDKTLPEIINLSREDVDTKTCKVRLQARDNNGIVKYRIRRNDEEENIREVEEGKEINEEITIRENGRYKITVEDVAGNKKEQEIEIEGLNVEHTVTFKNEDGSVIISQNYREGEKIVVPHEPVKQEDNTYTYEFEGWRTTNEEGQEVIVGTEEIENKEVTKDEEYIATYKETYKNYTIVFKDEDGRILTKKEDYHYGEAIEEPTQEIIDSLVKEADETYEYTFARWDKDVKETVEGNEEYIAVYEKQYKNYIVTFKDENGNVLIEKTDYHYGNQIAKPQTPNKPEDNTFTYIFTGWRTINDQGEETIVPTEEIPEIVTKNQEYIATYSQTYKNYTITFKDENGNILNEKTDYHYGDQIPQEEIPTPTKGEDETYTYEFTGWDKTVENTVTKDETYTATYNKNYKNYTVTFKDEDGTVLTEKTDYHYGDNVAVPQNPVKAEDETYRYEFTGWTPAIEEQVTEDKEYTATYEEEYKEYTITFKNDNGEILSQKTDYHYGEEIEEPEAPTKEEDETYTYEFIGWSPELIQNNEGEQPIYPEEQQEERKARVTRNQEYVARYEQVYKEYTVTFKQDSGETIYTQVYHYNDVVEMPENPRKESTMEEAYRFIGWTPEVEEGEEIRVTGNLEYVANYEAETINYTLKFYNDDYNEETEEGSLIEERTYNYGETIVFPRAEKEDTEEIHYVFESWINLGTEQESETQITIKMKAQYREEYYVARLEDIKDEEENIIEEGKSYFTLQEAIREARSSKREVRLLRDTEESVVVEDGQEIELNLNGKTVRGTREYGIKTYGELIVEDKTETKEGKIIESSEEETGYGIYNREGKVTIKSGIILGETNRENGKTYGIYNQSEELIKVEGGSILAEAKGENSISAGIYNKEGEKVEITGGLVYGNAVAQNSTTYGIYNETEGEIKQEGGIIQAKAALSSATSYGIYNKVSQEVEITGGRITAQSDNSTAYGIYNEEGKVKVEDGRIEVTARDGYGIYNEEGKVKVEDEIIEVTANRGYGIYNYRGEIETTKEEAEQEPKQATITMIGTTSYGTYNQEGTINIAGGKVELLGTNSYGIYNENIANITGGEINNKGTGSYTYGIYNNSNQDISVENITITGTERGLDNLKGNITVKGSNITATEGIYARENSNNIVVENTQIIATRNGINNNRGTVIIQSGTINSEGYGIYTTTNGITEIGTKDNNIETERPYIYGKMYAVYNELNQNAATKYYDGTLRGENVIYGGISEIEENSEIRITEDEEVNEEVATLQAIEQRNIARIGETEYRTLEDAIEAVAENQEESTEIEIIDDADITTTTEIPNNKNIEIDLNNHTLKTYATGGITNKGKLEIIDTQNAENQEEPAEGKIISKIGIGISNYGEIVLTKGIIKSNNYGIYNFNNGEVKVQGGTIRGRIYGIYSYLGGKTEITEGRVESEEGTGIDSYGSLNIIGGNIYGKKHGLEGDATIEGGTIISDEEAAILCGNTAIKGGYIESRGAEGIHGNTSIQGGTIIGKTYGIYCGYRVEIGNKDNTIDNENILIKGNEYGIKWDQAIISPSVYYYDGKIMGKTKALDMSIRELEDNTEVSLNRETIDNEEYEVATLTEETVYEEPIAQIGENTYTTVSSLKEGINSIEWGTEQPVEVKILNDFRLTQEILIDGYYSWQNVKIDLNGKTIEAISAINNYRGQLEITDSSEEHKGRINNINNVAIKNVSGRGLKITKGSIEGAIYGIVGDTYGNINTILGTKDGVVNREDILIKGGSQGIYGSKIQMYDGRIEGGISYTTGIEDLEEGYEINNHQSSGVYVTELKLEEPVARIGETDYYSIQTAIENAQEGDIIEILRNINKQRNTIIIEEGKDINLDLKGYTISTNLDKTIENNGTLTIKNSNGTITNNRGGSVTVENNGILNLENGRIEETLSGIGVENKGTLNMTGGTISGVAYGVENKENGQIRMTGGRIESSHYGIYNESTQEINIEGGTIRGYNTSYSTTCGIYNNANVNINITGGSINLEKDKGNVGYGYGIYNSKNGNINISTTEEISVEGYNYGYGIYNKEEGQVTVEKGTIEATNIDYLAYGIRNIGRGKVEQRGGTIEAETARGTAYGIENGVTGEVEITGGKIKAKTTEGTAYGINNISIAMMNVKAGEIKAEGENSYGIYNNSSDLIIGEKDEEVKTDIPIIEGDKEGIYIQERDAKFKFYDGKIIGGEAVNTEVNVPENYKVHKRINETTGKEEAIIIDKDTYIARFWNEGRTKIIAEVLFKSTDISINEPTPPSRSGYVGLWTEYEIKNENIDIDLYYVESRINGVLYRSQDDNEIYWNWTYQDGKATNVYYNSGTLGETVEIPSRLDGYPVTTLYNPNGYGRNIFTNTNYGKNYSIKQIIIPNTVKIIGNNAFYQCYRLESINLPNVTSIGSSAFNGCSNLINIHVPNVTTVGISAFYGCSSLTNIQISNVEKIEKNTFFNCINLTNIAIPNVRNIGESAFSGCSSLTDIVVPTITSIDDNAFKGCRSLTNIDISNIITIGNYVFYQCKSLTSIYIPNVTDIEEYAFCECSSLTNIEMSNVTSIGKSAFSGCSSLESVDIPNVTKIENNTFYGCSKLLNVNLYSVTEIEESSVEYDGAFCDCNSLVNIELPNIITIGKNAFFRCRNLESIELLNVTSIGDDAFSGCSSLENINVSEDNEVYSSVDGILYNKEKTQVIKCPEGKSEVTILESATNIGDKAFYNCDNLIEIELPHIINIGDSSFSYCDSLKSIEMPNVRSIGNNAFYGCKSLEEISLPSAIDIGSWAFSDCSKLISIDIPKVTIIKTDTFRLCTNLSNVIAPSVVEIEKGYYGAFFKCNSLENIELPNVTSIGEMAFDSCTNLTSVKLPKVINIGRISFARCKKLSEIEMPNVTNIENYAFSECSDLTEIYLSNVTNIADNAFNQCNNLKEIYLNQLDPSISWTSGCNAHIHYSDCTHLVEYNIENTLSINIQDESDNVIDNRIKCGETYKFKILDNDEDIIKGMKVRVKKDKYSTGYGEVIDEIVSDEEGIYTIEDIRRDITIIIGNKNGDILSAKDQKGITWRYSYQDGKAIGVTYLEGELGEVVEIPSTLDGYDVEGICGFGGGGSPGTARNMFVPEYSDENFAKADKIKKVIIPPSIKYIGDYTFMNLDLTSVEIPEKVTSIGYSAFESNNRLSSIRIPRNVTSIGSAAFASNKVMSDIYIDNEEGNISFGTSWSSTNWKEGTNAYVHYKDCTHSIEKNTKEGIQIQDVTDNLVNMRINCNDTYKFKLIDDQGNVLADEPVLIQSENRYSNEEYIKTIIKPNEDGIYTIENVNRNIIIKTESIAEDDIIQSIDNNGITWEYTYKNSEATNLKYKQGLLGTELEIPNMLDGYNVTSLGEYALEKSLDVAIIYLPNTMRTINDRALQYCSAIKDIFIDNEENSVEFGYSFNWNEQANIHYNNCKHNISVENYSYDQLEVRSVNSNEQIGEISCRQNYQFRLIDGTGKIVTSERIIIREGKDDILNSEQWYSGRTLRSMLDNANYLFLNSNENIYEIYPNEDGIYTIENIYKDIKIIIGSYQAQDENGITWNYSYEDGKATNVYYAYGELGETVIIPDTLDGYPVDSLYNKKEEGNIFRNANNISTIKNIRISNNVRTIGQFAFYKLPNLENIVLSNQLITIERAAFYKCTNLKKVKSDDSLKTIGEAAFAYCELLSDITDLSNVEKIEDDTFYRCSSLTEIILTNATSVGYEAFYECYNLEKIKLQNTITIQDAAFHYCRNLSEIELPKVENIGRSVFYCCSNLVSIELPNLTSMEENEFYYCNNLININVSENNKHYSSVNGVLYNKEKTELIKCPKGKTELNIEESVKSIGKYAFSGCKLTEIALPNVIDIGDYAFYECMTLEMVEMPNVTNIGESAFVYCTLLEKIKLPKVKNIGRSAFCGCRNIEKIEIPITVDYIGYRVFDDWRNYQTIYIEAEEKPENWDSRWNEYCNANIVWGYIEE